MIGNLNWRGSIDGKKSKKEIADSFSLAMNLGKFDSRNFIQKSII